MIQYQRVLGLILIMGLGVASVGASGDEDTMKDQTLLKDGSAEAWYVVNDGVMGGLSRSQMQLNEAENLVFSGTLSLENNGGFASVRYDLEPGSLEGFAGLHLRVRGDGRTYQLRLHDHAQFDGVAYRAFFETADGEWTDTFLPFGDFQPSFRGRILQDRGPVEPSSIHRLAFMVADKNPGAFSLEVESVVAKAVGASGLAN